MDLKKNWLSILLSALLGFIFSITVMKYGFAHDDAKATQESINQKASKQELQEAYYYIDKQDNSIKQQILTHSEEDKQRQDIQIKWMQSIDQKLNLVLNRR